MNLSHVSLPTLDINRSVAFYRALGLRPIVEGPQYARLKSADAGATLSLIGVAKADLGGFTIYFETADLDTEVSRLQDLGILFTELPRVQAWNWKEARLKDPSGHSICLFWGGESRLRP